MSYLMRIRYEGRLTRCANVFIFRYRLFAKRSLPALPPPGHQLIDCLDHVRMAFTLSVVEAAPSRVLASGFPQEAKRLLRCASDALALAAILPAVRPPLQNCNLIEILPTPLA